VAKLGELRYEYEYDDQIVYTEVEKSLIEKKIEKNEGKAYYIQEHQKDPTLKY
jgi:hypothetical protein